MLTSLLAEFVLWPGTIDFGIGVHLSIAYLIAETDSDVEVVIARYAVVPLAT